MRYAIELETSPGIWKRLRRVWPSRLDAQAWAKAVKAFFHYDHWRTKPLKGKRHGG